MAILIVILKYIVIKKLVETVKSKLFMKLTTARGILLKQKPADINPLHVILFL